MKSTENKTIYDINGLVTQFYRSHLWSSAGYPGLKFLKERGLNDDTIHVFELGYAGGDNSVVSRLRSLGFTQDEIISAGISSTDNPDVDRFKDRIIFPIKDIDGRVVGFGGRAITNAQPIYLTTPQTPVFNANSCLFGIEFADCMRSDYLIVCEGFFDTLLLYQAGFDMTVGYVGLGNPLEADLTDVTKPIILTSDHYFLQNEVNKTAIKDFERAGQSVRILDISPCRDSAEFIMNVGKKAFKERLNALSA